MKKKSKKGFLVSFILIIFFILIISLVAATEEPPCCPDLGPLDCAHQVGDGGDIDCNQGDPTNYICGGGEVTSEFCTLKTTACDPGTCGPVNIYCLDYGPYGDMDTCDDIEGVISDTNNECSAGEEGDTNARCEDGSPAGRECRFIKNTYKTCNADPTIPPIEEPLYCWMNDPGGIGDACSYPNYPCGYGGCQDDASAGGWGSYAYCDCDGDGAIGLGDCNDDFTGDGIYFPATPLGTPFTSCWPSTSETPPRCTAQGCESPVPGVDTYNPPCADFPGCAKCVNLWATEVCDDYIDNDCQGGADCSDVADCGPYDPAPSAPPNVECERGDPLYGCCDGGCSGLTKFWPDCDGDSFGDQTAGYILACPSEDFSSFSCPHVTNNQDCIDDPTTDPSFCSTTPLVCTGKYGACAACIYPNSIGCKTCERCIVPDFTNAQSVMQFNPNCNVEEDNDCRICNYTRDPASQNPLFTTDQVYDYDGVAIYTPDPDTGTMVYATINIYQGTLEDWPRFTKPDGNKTPGGECKKCNGGDLDTDLSDSDFFDCKACNCTGDPSDDDYVLTCGLTGNDDTESGTLPFKGIDDGDCVWCFEGDFWYDKDDSIVAAEKCKKCKNDPIVLKDGSNVPRTNVYGEEIVLPFGAHPKNTNEACPFAGENPLTCIDSIGIGCQGICCDGACINKTAELCCKTCNTTNSYDPWGLPECSWTASLPCPNCYYRDILNPYDTTDWNWQALDKENEHHCGDCDKSCYDDSGNLTEFYAGYKVNSADEPIDSSGNPVTDVDDYVIYHNKEKCGYRGKKLWGTSLITLVCVGGTPPLFTDCTPIWTNSGVPIPFMKILDCIECDLRKNTVIKIGGMDLWGFKLFQKKYSMNEDCYHPAAGDYFKTHRQCVDGYCVSQAGPSWITGQSAANLGATIEVIIMGYFAWGYIQSHLASEGYTPTTTTTTSEATTVTLKLPPATTCTLPPGYVPVVGVIAPCFTSNTKILMADNSYKQIKDIKKGDTILSYNPKTRTNFKQKIIKNFIYDFDSEYLIINNKLGVTKNHSLNINNQWVQAGFAKIGDKLIDNNQNIITINSIQKITPEQPIKVYSIQPEKIQNYYAENILVHE